MQNTTNRKTAYAALPIVAQSWADKMGVKVTVGGNIAHTNGTTINIPNVNESFGSLDPIWGYMLHEAQHVKDTDFSIDRSQSPFFADMVNILEDVRLERAATFKFAGAQSMLDACAIYMVEQNHYSHSKENDTPASIISSYCLFYGQLNGVNQKFLQELLDSSTKALRKTMGTLETPLRAILDEAIIRMASTQDAAHYSQQILDLIKDEVEQQTSNQSGQGESQDNDAGQDQDSEEGANADSQGDQSQQSHASDDGDGDGDQSDSQNGQGNDNQEQSESKDQSAQGDNAQQESSDGQTCDQQNESSDSKQGDQKSGQATQASVQAMQDALNASKNDVLGDVRDALKRDLYSHNDESKATALTALEGSSNENIGVARYKVAMRESAGLRRQFTGLLQSDQHTADRRGRTGRLGNDLSRIIHGNTKLFTKRGIKRDTGAAIHILTDMSGSMGTTSGVKNWLDIAAEASATMFAAVQALPNTSCGLSFFDNYVYRAVPQGARLALYKSRLGFEPNGGTQTGEAILTILPDVLRCKQERKQIYILTDGEPNCDKTLKDAIRVAESYGVEVFGIGIQLPSVKQHFKNAVVIQNIMDLRKEMLQLARNAL